jgi:hypothetical protein
MTAMPTWDNVRPEMHLVIPAPPTYGELKQRYWKWEAVGVAFILVGIAVSWVVLVGLAGEHFYAREGEVYWLSPATLVWGVPAFFSGILLATWPTDLVYRRLLGDRYAEFRDYQARKFGYDGPRWLPLFYLVFGTATAGMIAVLFDFYVCFGPNSIEIDEMWTGRPYRYAYDQIIEIRASDWRESVRGDLVQHYTLALHFSDGNVWSSNRDQWYEGRQRLREIAAYVSARAGIPIVELSVLSRAELLPTGLLDDLLESDSLLHQ